MRRPWISSAVSLSRQIGHRLPRIPPRGRQSVGPAAITLDPFEKAFEIRPQLGCNIPGCERSTRPSLDHFLLLARGLAGEQSRGDFVPL